MSTKLLTEAQILSEDLIAFSKSQCKNVANVCEICCKSLRNGNKILICGNGGSAADAQHFAAELVGRYKRERKALAAIALTTDTSNLTAIGNDYGFNTVFSRQVQGLGKNGDVLICISTSGNSQNVIEAVNAAKSLGLRTISLTGKSGGVLKSMTDININIQSSETNHVQEIMLFVEHMICEWIEDNLFNEN